MIGRPWIFAAAARGESGVRALLNTFKSEMNVAMALAGVTRVADVSPAVLDRTKPTPPTPQMRYVERR
jgi:L-lactate dehydrogenase (cytochrome)